MSTCTPTPTTSSDPFNPSKEQTHFDSGLSSHLHDYFNKQAKEYDAKAGDVTRSIARKAVGYLGKLEHDVRNLSLFFRGILTPLLFHLCSVG